MDALIDLTQDNLDFEQLCCIVRKKPHSGICAKREWLRERLREGHVFRKLAGAECAFIEYAPLETADGYRLLALSFDGTLPHFLPNAKRQAIDDRRFTVYYDDQCPFIPQRIEKLRAYCEQNGIDANFIHVETPEQAKELPCVFNNWAAFANGKFVTVNQLDGAAVQKLLGK